MQLERRLQIIEGKRSGRGNAFVGREEEICELMKSWTPMKGVHGVGGADVPCFLLQLPGASAMETEGPVRGWDDWKVVRHQVEMKDGPDVTRGEAASSHKSLSSISNLSEDSCSYSSFSL